MTNPGTPHVVILGAGFGGLNLARELAGKPVRATLIDRNNYHLFQPLLYQVATSTLSSSEIAYPIRAVLRRGRNVEFRLGEVTDIDLERRCLRVGSEELYYDSLVLAVGGETNTFGIQGLEATAFGMKNLSDATSLRNHLLKQFETAVMEPDPHARKAMLNFVIAGGGATGVELAGAVCELISTVLRKDYHGIHQEDVQVYLLEAFDRLLTVMPPEHGQWTHDTLRRKGVHVRLGVAVSSYNGSIVQLKDGSSIATRTLIWAAGVRAASLLATLGLEQDFAGRVKVGPTLQVPGRPELFVIGDAAHALDKGGKPLPMLAPVAIQQAKTTSSNLVRMFEGKPLNEFVYKDPGIMATVGRNQAVVLLKGMKFYGFIAWIMWLVVHIMQLIGFRNRIVVMLNWLWSYLFYEQAERLIVPD